MSISRPEGTKHLTQAQVAQFVNDGFVIVPGLVDPDRVRAGLKELKHKTGIVPDESKTWPTDKNGMHVTQEGIAIDRTMCISPKLKAIVRELAGPAVTNEPGLSPILRFPQPGPKQFEPGGAHIDGTRQGNGLTVYPTHFLLLVMAYLTDTDAHDGAFTVWPGSPATGIFVGLYQQHRPRRKVAHNRQHRRAGHPAQRSHPRRRTGGRRGDMPLSDGTRIFRQPGRPRPRWVSRMAEGNPRISIHPKNGTTPNELDPVGLDIENGQFTLRKEVFRE